MHLSLLPILLLTTMVLADGASILAALSSISNSTIALDNTISTFPSGLLGLTDILPLLSSSTALLSSLDHGISIASASSNLTILESLGIAQATINLASTVNTTLTALIAAKEKFDHLLVVSPVVLVNLLEEKEKTDKFGEVVVSKVPASLQSIAESLLVPIDDSFEEAIAVYE